MDLSLAHVAAVAAIFVVSGSVKGVTGMGLPTVAIGLLGLLMAPVEAAALLVVPTLVTNVMQFAAGPNRLRQVRRMWPMLLATCLATFLSTGLIAKGDAGQATLALGLVLIVYAAVGLAQVRLRVPSPLEPWLSPIMGAATGLVAGATGVSVIPAAPYLQALGLEKEDLVQALGLSFTASTIALAAGLASHGAFHVPAAGASALCIAPALLGMSLGQWIRLRVDAATFRLVFLIGLLALGGEMVARWAI
jgi:uncharacterized membrane protein YfcA